MPSRNYQDAVRVGKIAATLISVTLVVAILYWAQVVLIPFALAGMLTFVLSPVVSRLDRWGLNRVVAVLVSVGGALIVLAGIMLIVVSQLHSLAEELPSYRHNIREKFSVLRQNGSDGTIAKVRSTLQEAAQAEEPEKKPEEDEPFSWWDSSEPVVVKVLPEENPDEAFTSAWTAALTVMPLMGALAAGGFSLVLVIFMLIQREDMRNRLVSFTPQSSVAITTKALDDAGSRISRYLLMQLIVNGSFGVAVGIGLLLIGVPYALLWGLCATVFRYIPYIGPWVAALLPLAVSTITLPGWTSVLLVVGLFLVLELISNNIIEPLLYGQGIGISTVALLVSAAFWTWIWGPVGLILATPLSVCLLVLGKYVPALSFLDRLLGDRPALPPHVVLLQRILAKDGQEAGAIVRKYRADSNLEQTYDGVLIPTLRMARAERVRGTMAAAEEAFLLNIARDIVQELSASRAAPEDTVTEESTDPDEVVDPRRSPKAVLKRVGSPGPDTVADTDGPPLVRVLGCSSHQEAEEVTLRMLDSLLRPEGIQLDVVSMRTLPSQFVERVAREQPQVVIISNLPPGGLPQARYLCKLLRKRFPELGIIVGSWGYKGSLDRTIAKFRSAGAQYVTTTLAGARDHTVSLVRSAQTDQPDSSDRLSA